MNRLLQVENISKSFEGAKIIDDISFDIYEGEIIALLGESGSGKSTLLNLIAGFLQSTKGIIKIQNNIVTSKSIFIPPEKRKIGFLFQNFALFPHLNVRENIAFGLKKDKQKRVEELLQLVKLEHLENRYPHELSGGQQQKIALLRSIAPVPKFILMDEPFSNIDYMAKDKLHKQLLDILKTTHTTAMIVTHDANEAMRLANRILYLQEGKILQDSSVEDFYKKPRSKKIARSSAIANFIKKEETEYLLRGNDIVISLNGEYKATILDKYFQGEQYIYEATIAIKNGSQKIKFYSTQNTLQREIYIDILWSNAYSINTLEPRAEESIHSED